MMRNQHDYFDRVIKVLKELKKDHPLAEISTHFILATDSDKYPITDKELYNALMKHKAELDMNTLPDSELEKVIEETDDLFTEVEPEDIEDLEDEY